MKHLKPYKLYEDVETNGFLYHGTSNGAVRRIQRDGLTPQKNVPIFLSSTEEYAGTYASRKDFRGGVILRVVNNDKFKVADNIQGFGNYTEYYTHDIIKPEDIEIKQGTNWVSLSDANLNEGMFGDDTRALKSFEKIMTKAVVDFFKRKSGVDAQIIVKHKPSDKYIGDIKLNDTTVIKNKFIVFFDNDQGTRMSIKSLFHELTHVKQVNKKELLPAEDYNAINWNGKEFITATEYNKLLKIAQKDPKEYNNLPWEKEAIESSETLMDEFLKSPEWKGLKGKDKNLDFMIDNI